MGSALLKKEVKPATLKNRARRFPRKARNVVARLNPGAPQKIVIIAHIDTSEGSPGALDNASGVTVLLLTREMLTRQATNCCIEIAALNGEDHYSAGWQMDYLSRFGAGIPLVLLAVNVDGVGYLKGRATYSCYQCSEALEGRIRETFVPSECISQGDPWFSGDHMIFAQRGVPSVAISSDRASGLMHTLAQTSEDKPELIVPCRLVEIANALTELVRAMGGWGDPVKEAFFD